MDHETDGDKIEDVEDFQPQVFNEMLKTHLKNLLEIPKTDPRTNIKITLCSALSAGFLATVLFALR